MQRLDWLILLFALLIIAVAAAFVAVIVWG
jgi:hypothetical protein